VKKFALTAVPALLLLPAVTLAQSALVGTWKADISDYKPPTKPNQYLLSHGVYHCKTCAPPYAVKADGQDHAVTGHPYYDSVAITVVDANTISEIDKKGGKTVTTGTMTISSDGKSMQFEFSDSSNSNGAPIVGKGTATRLAKGPASSHAVSGSWRTTKITNLSDNGLITTYALSGTTLKMTDPTGQSYSAPVDGTDSPFMGDPGQTSVSIKRIDDNTVDEIDRRDGKVIGSAHISVSADGKTMTVKFKDDVRGTSGTYTATKQ
jgi:hypothetical protein